MQLGDGNTLPGALVLELMRAQAASADGKASVEFLFATLEKFLAERDARGGLRLVFAAYEAWLHEQEWYTLGSPDWITPPSSK